jgi:L-asparaginase II
MRKGQISKHHSISPHQPLTNNCVGAQKGVLAAVGQSTCPVVEIFILKFSTTQFGP